ncbi:MAG: T9SS type A sorting domain-containing protein [Flavobacteriales bacterium]|nr:T9SS type A sorting domain-containing protein [Flavobacteriales bacterium]
MKSTFTFLLLQGAVLSGYGQQVTTFLNSATEKVNDGMVLDRAGNLYGSHYAGANVYKVEPDGTTTTFATGFDTPNGLAFDSQENLFVADLAGGHIYKLSHTGTFLDTIDVSNPSGIIKAAGSDTMIFTQYYSHTINKLAPDGTIVPWFSGAPLNGPVGLAVDSAGNVFVGNFNDRKIYRLYPDSLAYVATVPGPSTGWLGFITYTRGMLWGTSFNSHKIYSIHPYELDSVSLFAGGAVGSLDGPVGTARFNSPNGIIASLGGDSLYISEANTGKVRIIADLHTTGGINEELRMENEGGALVVFPNPGHDEISVKLSKPIVRVEVLNLQGAMVAVSGNQKIPVRELVPGMYMVKVYTDDGMATGRFMKR